MAFARKILEAGVSGSSSELGHVDLQGVTEVAYYVVFGPGTSAGALQIEEAPTKAYGGTWSPIGSAINWSAASKVHVVRSTGVGAVARVRITTPIVGGTVDVWAFGR